MTKGWPPATVTPVTKFQRDSGDGDRVIRFIETFCRITKDSIGGQAGELIHLLPWQKQITRDIFARRADLKYRHRQCYIGIARKQGKSALISGYALYSLLFGPQGGEVIIAASTKEQAKIVFGNVKRMVQLDPDLSREITTYAEAMHLPSLDSVIRVVAADAPSLEGLNPSFVILDEVHTYPNRELYDVLALASGARVEPMMVGITTAGKRTDSSGDDSLAYRLYQYGKKVAAGEIEDKRFYCAWWEPKASDVKSDNKTAWRQANPGLGDLIDPEEMESAHAKTPEAEFRTKRLNQWVDQDTAWLPEGTWEALESRTASQEPPRYVLGLDGSYSNDSTAVIAVTVEKTPRISVVGIWERDDDRSWRVPIADVENTVAEFCKVHDVVEIACDPYRWQRTMAHWVEEGMPVLEYPQAQPMTEPVLTPAGWQEIGSLKVGSEVTSPSGKVERVTEVHQRGVEGVFTIRFSDGTHTQATADHLWSVQTADDKRHYRGYRTLTTAQILQGGLKSGKGNKWFLPLPEPQEQPEQGHLISPYTLGVYLGDGNSTGRATPRFTNSDSEIVDRVRYELIAGVHLTGQGKSGFHFAWTNGGHGCKPNLFLDELRRLGICGLYAWEKRIPSEYLSGSIRQRRDLLHGLMDTDGDASKKGTATFNTTSPMLADGVVELARGLGGVAKVSVTPIKGKMKRLGYRVRVSLPVGRNPFWLSRKANRVKRTLDPSKAIVSIKPSESCLVRCISVSDPDGLYITRGHTVTHNSPNRMVPATQRFFEAVVNKSIVHSGDPHLTRHMRNAAVKIDSRGSRIVKSKFTRKVDAAIATVMAYDRAAWWHEQPKPKSRKAFGFSGY